MPENSILEGPGLLRLSQFVGPILPISPRTWWRGVATGKYPPGRKLGPKIRAWEKSDIRKVLAEIAADGTDKAA